MFRPLSLSYIYIYLYLYFYFYLYIFYIYIHIKIYIYLCYLFLYVLCSGLKAEFLQGAFRTHLRPVHHALTILAHPVASWKQRVNWLQVQLFEKTGWEESYVTLPHELWASFTVSNHAFDLGPRPQEADYPQKKERCHCQNLCCTPKVLTWRQALPIGIHQRDSGNWWLSMSATVSHSPSISEDSSEMCSVIALHLITNFSWQAREIDMGAWQWGPWNKRCDGTFLQIWKSDMHSFWPNPCPQSSQLFQTWSTAHLFHP